MGVCTSSRRRYGRVSNILMALLGLLTGAASFGPWPPAPPRARLQQPGLDTLVGFSPDGQTLVTTSHDYGDHEGKSVLVWDARTGLEKVRLAADWYPPFVFSPDNRLLAVPEGQGELGIWDITTGQRRGRIRWPEWHDGPVHCRFSPDSRTLFHDGRDRWALDGGTVKLWDVETAGDAASIDGMFDTLTFSPDGKRFALWSGDRLSNRHVRLWEWAVGHPRPLLLREHLLAGSRPTSDDAPKLMVAFSPDLKLFAVARDFDTTRPRSRIQLHDLETGREQCSFSVGRAQTYIERVTFSADASTLIISTWARPYREGKLSLWDLRAVPPREMAMFADQSAASPALSPDGKLRVVRRDDGMELFSVAGSQTRAVLSHPGDSAFPLPSSVWEPPATPKLTFSPDGAMATVTDLCHLPGPEGWLMQRVRAVLPLKDHRYSGLIGRLWDTATGRELQAFEECADAVFSPDGRTLAVRRVGEHCTIELWDVPPRTPRGRVVCWAVACAVLSLLSARWLVRRARAAGTGNTAGEGRGQSRDFPASDQGQMDLRL